MVYRTNNYFCRATNELLDDGGQLKFWQFTDHRPGRLNAGYNYINCIFFPNKRIAELLLY